MYVCECGCSRQLPRTGHGCWARDGVHASGRMGPGVRPRLKRIRIRWNHQGRQDGNASNVSRVYILNTKPETQTPVPAMFRVCAFGPANIPICAGMLMTVSATTTRHAPPLVCSRAASKAAERIFVAC